jgi:hypothetical protein
VVWLWCVCVAQMAGASPTKLRDAVEKYLEY